MHSAKCLEVLDAELLPALVKPYATTPCIPLSMEAIVLDDKVAVDVDLGAIIGSRAEVVSGRFSNPEEAIEDEGVIVD